MGEFSSDFNLAYSPRIPSREAPAYLAKHRHEDYNLFYTIQTRAVYIAGTNACIVSPLYRVQSYP